MTEIVHDYPEIRKLMLGDLKPKPAELGLHELQRYGLAHSPSVRSGCHDRMQRVQQPEAAPAAMNKIIGGECVIHCLEIPLTDRLAFRGRSKLDIALIASSAALVLDRQRGRGSKNF